MIVWEVRIISLLLIFIGIGGSECGFFCFIGIKMLVMSIFGYIDLVIMVLIFYNRYLCNILYCGIVGVLYGFNMLLG